MKMPQRVPQHISETASFKLFSEKIPDKWIIREVTERDYGVDCYLEIVNDDNSLTGDLAIIQLKSMQSIPWTKNDTYLLADVKISTTNYLYKFAVPTFIFLADISSQELFLVQIHYEVQRNFLEYAKQDKFSFRFKKSNKFEGKDGEFLFKFKFYYQNERAQFENELLFFLSALQHFKDFQSLHTNLDYHLGLEDEDQIFFEAMHRNYSFLTIYLNLDNPVPSLNGIKKKSREKFKGEFHYELYEHDLSEWMPAFEDLTKKIIIALKEFMDGESHYWMIKNMPVHNYINNLDEEGNLY